MTLDFLVPFSKAFCGGSPESLLTPTPMSPRGKTSPPTAGSSAERQMAALQQSEKPSVDTGLMDKRRAGGDDDIKGAPGSLDIAIAPIGPAFNTREPSSASPAGMSSVTSPCW
ncbi:hypothetical protein EYF80_026707 [Liparis tanakae]|uniref:Uncharacterized protein n=1 Tax=Liparis tanakae TaxID=230148 RepID=A0A4Z2HBT7_9TELE|nr:hypothetical protein EYF80_026707 [Liparis tanakae]